MAKLTGPNPPTAGSLAEESGVHQSTLARWLREERTVESVKKTKSTPPRVQHEAPAQQKRPDDWSPREKLQAVMEASVVSDDELGEWLRRRGLHEAQLVQWRESVMGAAEEALTLPRKRRKGTSESKRIKELERELKRKDRALAETAALLVLRKKLDALWGDEDAATEPTNDDESSR